MNRINSCILILFVLSMFAAPSLYAGYRIEPWGSKTWTGPGRPPHWSAAPDPQPVTPTMQGKSNDHRKKYRPDGRDAFHKDLYNRHRSHHRSRVSGSISYEEPRVKEVIIERETQVPVYIETQRKPARLLCGGQTITRQDTETGELIIEYVTGARDC